MTLVHPLSLLPPPFNNEGNFQDHCVANTPPPAPVNCQYFNVFFSHLENMVEMFSVAVVFYFIFIFFKFCLGLLISAPNSVSADLGKPVANLKTTLVHIPLRIDK